jgi:hypothetical protein
MITRNFKSLLGLFLQASTVRYASLPVKIVTGKIYYAGGAFAFPISRTQTLTKDPLAAGISVGTGGTAATEDDFNLENTITSSSITMTMTGTQVGCDDGNKPWIKYSITITNDTGDTLTIREIGYKQTVSVMRKPSASNTENVVCLLDRTVLDTPVEITPGDAGIIEYKLQTNLP